MKSTSPLLQRAAMARTAAHSSQRGLTIVEIMVVIAILGTLMTIVAVNVIGSLDEANSDATRLQIKKVEQGLQMYAAKNKGRYPNTSDGLEAAKKYFPDNKVPTDAWGYEFQYYSPGSRSGGDYDIISLGKDGQEGGEGTNADIYSWDDGEGED